MEAVKISPKYQVVIPKKLKEVDELVVPTISIYEVFKSVLRQRDESAGFQAVALMKQG